MRDYGKVHTSFWTSQTTRTMSEDARAMAIYLLTCPHGTISGAFRLPDGYVCDDLQWTPERVNSTLIELLNKGFANRCETTKWVWIYKHFEWNKPENPNQFKSAAKIAQSIPDECSWKQDYMRKNAFFLGLDYKQFDNPSETLSQPVTVTVAVTETVTVAGTVVSGAEESAPKKQIGTSLPKDWVLPKKWGEWALAERPEITEEQIRKEAEKFKDHWLANSNQAKAKKADWEATWRNWIRAAKFAVVKPPPDKSAYQQSTTEQAKAKLFGTEPEKDITHEAIRV